MTSLIGLCGYAGAGKDTVADMLVKKGYTKLSFADSLKDAVADIFGWDRNLLEGKTEKSRKFREKKDTYWSKKFGRKITPRIILQEFGTNLCRDHLLETIWIDSLERKIKGDTVISDVRFENEFNFIKEHDGKIIRIVREIPEWNDLAIKACAGDAQAVQLLEEKGVHQSEYNILNYEPTFTIKNTKGIESLQETVDNIMKIMG